MKKAQKKRWAIVTMGIALSVPVVSVFLTSGCGRFSSCEKKAAEKVKGSCEANCGPGGNYDKCRGQKDRQTISVCKRFVKQECPKTDNTKATLACKAVGCKF